MRSPFLRSVVFLVLALFAACGKVPEAPKPKAASSLAPRAVEHAPRAHDYDVLHYRLEIAVDPETKRFEGSVELAFRPLVPGFRTLRLDCGDYEVREARQGERDLRFEKKGESLEVFFPVPLRRGEESRVTISYGGVPSRGVYFVGSSPEEPGKPDQAYTQGECEDIRYVFPCYDYPNDKATSELLLTVPEKYRTIAVGALVASSPAAEAGLRTDHWKMDVPHSSYLTTFAVGPFVEVREEWNGIPVLYYGDPGDEERLRLSFGKTPKALQFFSDYIGVPYPYPKYAQVCVHEFPFGGMENISATTQTRGTLHEASSEPLANSDGLMAHELAHQWWGNLVTCADWSHIWLNEGFATYFESLFREFDRGVDEFRLAMRGHQEAACKADEESIRPIVHGVYADPLDLFYSGHVYPGGASRLHLLRFVLGDERFREGIRRYAESFREKNATTEDFRLAMEEASGEKLGWFFEQWLYSPGYPKFRVRYDWEESDSSFRVRVEQTQKAEKGALPAYRTPVQLEFTLSVDPPQKERFRATVSERLEHFVFRLPAKPLMARFDEGGWIPKALEEEKSPDEWLFQLRRDEDAIGRLEAARSIGKLLAPSSGIDSLVRERFVEGLADAYEQESFYGVANEILGALAEAKSEIGKKALLRALGNADARIRRRAAERLGAFEDDAGVWQALRRLFGAEKNGYVAAEVCGALVRAKDPEAGEFLLQALDRDSDGEAIRAAALAALGDLGHPQAAPLALRYSRPGHIEALRVAAAKLLGKAGRGRAEAREGLAELLGASSARIRTAAAEALGELGDSSAVEALSRRHAVEPFPRTKRAIEKAVAKLEAAS